MHTAELLVPDPSALEVETTIAEQIKVGGNTVRSYIYYLEYGELTEEWRESIILPIYKKADKTNCNNYRDI
jgi:hypothetical protein